MEQKNNTVVQIDDYFRAMNEGVPSEKETFTQLFAELASMHKRVSNKEIIAGLIQKLEIEKDVVKADIYRNMLEIMLRSTNNS
ncbi:biofilm development regulator YmgB/AriR family protein [Rahnella sp. WP5]|uniref:biofilm development regulator YmgB/AriR family protein n=1 Tax=Rahnella TaxID=34037 RepID=UPI000561690B|nr:biofilm development regulator YmgB/AriR family protein [Rahnella sp. WP5]